MTRSAVHRAIEFEGLIEGCADYQWLLTDAIYDAASSSPEPSPRWHIKSQDQIQDQAPGECSHQVHYQFRDRHLNWQLSAPSAAALAEQIRTRFHNHRTDQ